MACQCGAGPYLTFLAEAGRASCSYRLCGERHSLRGCRILPWVSLACSRSSRTCAGLGAMPFASPETASQSTCMQHNDPRLDRCVIVAPSGCRAPTRERTEVSESTQSCDCEESRANIHRSPREVAEIVCFGRDAEQGDERCVGICPSEVYLKNDAATIRLREGVSELGGKE